MQHASPVLTETIPGVRVVREMARSGHAAVYEAVQIATDRRIALKVLAVGLNRHDNPNPLHEARLAALLRHPNIVTIYDCLELESGACAIAMEYVEGVSLDEWTRSVRERKDAGRLRLRLMSQICDAVQHAHQRGVMHRDLKPDNVRIDGDGVARILDFGTAAAAGQSGTALMFTPAYAAPEQLEGGAVDTRADVFALGAMFRELLTGYPPGADPPAVGDRDLEAIIRTATHADRDRRYPSAAAMREDIENYLARRPISPRADEPWYILRCFAARRRVLVGVAAGVLVLLIAFGLTMAALAGRLAREREVALATLAEGNIRNARLLSATGRGSQAQALIWPEFFRAGGDASDPGLGFSSDPVSLPATWALFEYFARQPCLASTRTGPTTDQLEFTSDDEVRGVLADGSTLEATLGENGLVATVGRSAFRPGPGEYLTPGAGVVLVFGETDLRTVDPATGKAVCKAAEPAGRAVTARFSPDGSVVATVDEAGALCLRDSASLTPSKPLSTIASPSSRPAFSADGRLLAVGQSDGTLGVWEVRSGTLVKLLHLPERVEVDAPGPDPIYCPRFSPDGTRLAAACLRYALVWDLVHGGEALVFEKHSGFVKMIAFNADGRLLLTSANDKSFRVWDMETGQAIMSTDPSRIARTVVSLNADGTRAVGSDGSGVLRVWETRPNGWVRFLPQIRQTIHCVRFSPDGSVVGAATSGGAVRLWDAHHPGSAREIAHAGAVHTLAFSPDGRTLATTSVEGSIKLWDVASCLPKGAIEAHLDQGNCLAFSPSGSVIGCVDRGKEVLLWDLASPGSAPRRLSGHTQRVPEFAFSPDGKVIATVSIDRTALLWSAATGTVSARLSGHEDGVRAVCFSPDGTLVATGSDDRTIRIWDAKTGAFIRMITGLHQDVFSMAFHPDGKVLFSSGREAPIQVWDVRGGAELACLSGHTTTVLSLAMSPDGRTLASADGDGVLGLWDLKYYQRHVRGNAGLWAEIYAGR